MAITKAGRELAVGGGVMRDPHGGDYDRDPLCTCVCKSTVGCGALRPSIWDVKWNEKTAEYATRLRATATVRK